MKILSGITVAGLMVTGLMFASTDSLSQDACEHGGHHTIQVRPGEGDKAVLRYRGGSGEYVHVCVGDRVQWVLVGSDRQFFVNFESAAPFPGDTSVGSSDGVVSVVIAGERGNYTYGVKLDGGPPIDPHIIVE